MKLYNSLTKIYPNIFHLPKYDEMLMRGLLVLY